MADDLQRRIDELEQALERERRRLGAERQRSEREIAAARRSAPSDRGAAAAEKEIARLERKLAGVYSSHTWRAGRVIWRAFDLPRSIARRLRGQAAVTQEPVEQQPMSTPAAVEPNAPESIPRVEYSLVENHVVKDKYQAAISRSVFSGRGSGRNIAIAVSTTDLNAGRGDIYTAVGLGRHLEMLGHEVVYLPRDRWYELPRNTDAYVAMLETVDVAQLPADVITIAWVRNETETWVTQPSLPLYNLVLSSSERSLEAIHHAFHGATGLLPIGVDTELFKPTGRTSDRRGVVSTVNQWGRERELHMYLQEATVDFPLALFGQQRGMAPELAKYCEGPVSYFALPSLYNEAAIVLDDFNHTTAGYGNVNSRVFEAAACGAIVMTNRPSGLEGFGFGDVPVFTSASEMCTLIARDFASIEAMKSAGGRAERVREAHSYQARAQQFDGYLRDLAAGPPHADERRVIGYFPDYRDNPYLDMMWSDLTAHDAVPVAVANSLDFSAILGAADNRNTLFHLNWTAPILGAGRDDADRRHRYRVFLEALDRLRDRGVPTIWTVHNVLPHECADPNLEAQLRQEVADRVDLIHVMSSETAALCSGYFELPQSKIRMLPHPSYVDVYPNLVDKETARYELGLRHDDFVYLHLGKIRPYKGVDKLLDAFDRLVAGQRGVKLLLVGEPGRFDQLDEIKQRARANPHVISNFNTVPDADLQLYLNAADVVVLPYRKILNSGALQLAYSFGKPVVAAAVGSIPQHVDNMTGVTFSWDDGEPALLNAMLAARSLGPEHGRAAYEKARLNHYLEVSAAFSRLVDEVSR